MCMLYVFYVLGTNTGGESLKSRHRDHLFLTRDGAVVLNEIDFGAAIFLNSIFLYIDQLCLLSPPLCIISKTVKEFSC